MNKQAADTIVAALIAPAIERFISEYPVVTATFSRVGENVRIHLYQNLETTISDSWAGKTEDDHFAMIELTPEQQSAAVIEFLDITREGKR